MDTARCVRESGSQTPLLNGLFSSNSSCHDNSVFETASEAGNTSEAESESSAKPLKGYANLKSSLDNLLKNKS